jgi:peroxiredoxin
MQFRFLASMLLILSGWGIAAVSGAEAPQPSRIGRQIENFKLGDVRGKAHSLADWKDSAVVVVAFIGVECPLAKQYAGRLVEIAGKYQDQGVRVVAIDSNQQDSLAELGHFERTYKIEFPLLKDPGNAVADLFTADRTPEVFVLDADRKVQYYGRIDNQFTYGRQKNAADRNYLIEAIDALLAHKPVPTPETESIGCHIGRVLEARGDSHVTYSQQISRILNKRCVECHRPGEIGPFSLRNYEEVVGWAEMIDEVVQEERMPPWHANPEHGKFANDIRLSDEDKQLIRDWVAAGAPQGDPADLPVPPEFVAGWRIGEPDLVVYMSDKSFKVPARGEVRYQYFLVDPGFKEDKWIQAAECRPGNRAVVHHIIVAVKPPGKRGAASRSELDSDWLTATAPGAQPLMLKEGLAKFIPAGSQLIFQMHYTPNGTAQEDRSCVGFKFADPKTVRREVATQKAANDRFVIPPGDDNHRVEAEHRFDKDSLLLALFPHMHLRGKSFRYEAIYPDGKREVLLDVPHYDFNWQNGYALAEPKLLPAGTRMHCTAYFDNSEDNLANPDPTATVRWGDQTWEEMMIGYFDIALADQDLTKQPLATARVDQFLAAYQNGQTEVDPQLLKLAAGATDSNTRFIALGTALRSQFPQLDRVCLTTLDGETLEVTRAVQEPRLRATLGATGIKVAAQESQVAAIAQGSKAVVYNDLDTATAPDLKLMSRGVASSLHVPVKIDGAAATVNFWSIDKDAFPPEAVKLLEELAQAMAK